MGCIVCCCCCFFFLLEKRILLMLLLLLLLLFFFFSSKFIAVSVLFPIRLTEQNRAHAHTFTHRHTHNRAQAHTFITCIVYPVHALDWGEQVSGQGGGPAQAGSVPFSGPLLWRALDCGDIWVSRWGHAAGAVRQGSGGSPRVT